MLFVYRILINLFFPILIISLKLRVLLGKEDKIRFKEKYLIDSSIDNRDKNKQLIWFHAASIGEVTSIIDLIKSLDNQDSKLEFLITTVTLSSGKICEKIFDKKSNIHHRYFPIDSYKIVKKFLSLYNPNLVIFVDSEIWPNFLLEIKKKNIPLVLLNARITNKTLKRWKLFPRTASKVFNTFDLCISSSINSKDNLEKLNAKNVKYFGNLKFSTNFELTKLNNKIDNYLSNFKVWCATNTHEGEELLCINTHKEIKKNIKNVITIIIPRHINRVPKIITMCKDHNLKIQILDEENTINKQTEILIVNSFGVLPKYYDYCDSVFIGKSTLKKLRLVGGQNPIEAAKLGCKIYHGKYVYNFQEVYSLLNSYEISQEIVNHLDLAEKITLDFEKTAHSKNKNIDTINQYRKKILETTNMEIKNILKNENL
jgi:3-deoxy-D-manno-octulosonic-acid transferase